MKEHISTEPATRSDSPVPPGRSKSVHRVLLILADPQFLVPAAVLVGGIFLLIAIS